MFPVRLIYKSILFITAVSGFSLSAFASCPTYIDELNQALEEVNSSIRSVDGSIEGVQAGLNEIRAGNRSGTVSDTRADAAATARSLNTELRSFQSDRAEFVREKARLEECRRTARPRPPSIERPANPPREYVSLSACAESTSPWSARCNGRVVHSARLRVAHNFSIGAGESSVCFVDGNVISATDCDQIMATDNSTEIREPRSVCRLTLNTDARNPYGSVWFGSNSQPLVWGEQDGNPNVSEFRCTTMRSIQGSRFCRGTVNSEISSGSYRGQAEIIGRCGRSDKRERDDYDSSHNYHPADSYFDPQLEQLAEQRLQIQEERFVNTAGLCELLLPRLKAQINGCSSRTNCRYGSVGSSFIIDSRDRRATVHCNALIRQQPEYQERVRQQEALNVERRAQRAAVDAQINARIATINECHALYTDSRIPCYGREQTTASRADIARALGGNFNVEVETTVPFDIQATEGDGSEFNDPDRHAMHSKKKTGRGIASVKKKSKH